MKTWLIALFCVALLVPAGMSGATILVQTGPTGWTVTSPSNVTTTPFVTTGGVFPFPIWGPPQDGAPDWITPQPGYASSPNLADAQGIWAFTYTFNRTGAPGPATMIGTLGFDNYLNSVLVNGNNVGLSSNTNQFSGAWPVNLSSVLLLTGTNQITFFVENLAGETGNPVGLYADLTLQMVPEPSTWMMLASGLGLALVARRRVRK